MLFFSSARQQAHTGARCTHAGVACSWTQQRQLVTLMPGRRRLTLLLVLLLHHLLLDAASVLQHQQQHPGWLLGLADLQQQHDSTTTTTASILSQDGSVHHQQHPEAAAGTLLRPQSLPPPPPASQLASLQQQHPHPAATLAKVAARYALPQPQLQRMMQQDPGLLVTTQGLLVWSCLGHDHLPGSGDTDTTTAATSSSSSEGHTAAAAVMAAASLEADGGDADDDADGSLFTIVLPPGGAATQQDSSTTPDAEVTPFASLQSTSPAAAAASKAQTAATVQPGPQPPPEDAFRLHSRPPGSVQHTIFLDFRGCSISGSYWNMATGKPVLQTQPFDLDGDPSTFSDQEREAVVVVWQAVAQDYAAFAVDVTTEPQDLDRLVKSSEGDTEFGMHVCIGGSSATTVGGLSGGLAFTGAWGQLGPALQPVLVFPEQLGSGHPRAIADSVSHEVGHTLSLVHFGGSGAAPYNDGAGPWGPLLGLPYGRVLSQWSKGTAVTGMLQDDLALISQQLPSLPDDHGGGPATATPLCDAVAQAHHHAQQLSVCKRVVAVRGAPDQDSSSSSAGNEPSLARAVVRGMISNSTDQDWFRLEVGQAGPVAVKLQLPSSTAQQYGVNNLLAAVAVFAADGQQLAAVQPEASGSGVLMQATVEAPGPGTLYVSVAPVGIPGVSSYGSVGNYVLTVTFPTAAPAQQQQQHAGYTAGRRCQLQHCAPCAGCGSCGSADAQQCTCAASRGLVPKPLLLPTPDDDVAATATAAAAPSTTPSCQYQDVRALSFSARACSTATAGAVVLLNFTVSSPPACFDGSIIASAPRLELLGGGAGIDACAVCRQSPRRSGGHLLPVAAAGASAVAADGSYTCRSGVYSYGWRVPHTAGCYRLRVALADGSSVATVLRVVAAEAV